MTGTKNSIFRRIESTGEKKGNDYTLNKSRFQSPSFATLYTGDENGVNKTNVYLAFYDSTNGELRFRAGELKSNTSTNFGSFQDNFNDANGSGVTPNNYGKDYKGNAALVQIIANKAGNGLGYAGDYVSLGVTSDNVVVIIWYDAQNNKLKFSYNKDPLNKTHYSGTFEAKAGAFETAETLMDGGKYCQLVVAGDNSIHIAAYDNINLDLKYIYIPYDAEKEEPLVNSMKIATVDSYLSTGKELTIDVAKEGNNYIPHIGYNGNTPKKPRYAYIANPGSFFASSNAKLDGVDNDKFNGIWECMLVPTTSKITKDNNKRRINVGVWKSDDENSKGKRASSTPGNSSAASGSGSCYGNGTNNAVLGYGVIHSSTQDYVETAQMR